MSKIAGIIQIKYFVLIAIISALGNVLLSSQSAYAQYQGHGAESVKPEVLKKYAPPALNPVMNNKLKKMFDISSPGMGILSPDKKTLYFSWRVTGQSQVWKINGPQKFPVQLTSGADAVSINDITPNGKYLIISKDVDGQESPGLFKLDTKTGLINELYRKEKVKVYYSFITDDSKYMYFVANDKKPESNSIYKMDIETQKIESIYDGEGSWFVGDERENGKNLLLAKLKGARQIEYYDYTPATKKLTAVIGQDETIDYEVAYSRKVNEYLVLSNKDSDFKRLYLMSADKKLKPLTQSLNYDVSGFSTDHGRNRLMYNINKDGYTELRALDLKSWKEISLPKFPNVDHVFSGKTTRDGKVTMLGVITSTAPRLSYAYDWQSKKMTQWILPSSPEVETTHFSVARLMSYKTRDNVDIPMFVRFPEKCDPLKGKNADYKSVTQLKTNCPVVVHFHGGPEAQSTPGFSVVAQAFVDEGFIFVEPNVRGSDGYGKAWLDSDNGALREKVITDIEDASIWIKKNWQTEESSSGSQPLKVGVMGWSYGGYSTLMAMTKFAGSYEAGVALVGMSNLVSFLNNTAPYRRVLRVSEYGDPVKDKEVLLRLSPVTYVDQVKSPLLIIQGANDPRVPVGEAVQIQETLQKKKIVSELIIFADEGHGSSKKDNQVLEIGHTIEFFKKHLR